MRSNQDIGSWNTGKSDKHMGDMFQSLLRSTEDIREWEHSGSNGYERYVSWCASAFNHDISSWTGDCRNDCSNRTCLPARLRFKRNSRATTPSLVLRDRVY